MRPVPCALEKVGNICMTDWRAQAAQQHYRQIDWTELDSDARRAYLLHLRKVVPLVAITNGMERMERHATPKQMETIRLGSAEFQALPEPEQKVVRENLIEAAMVLYLGELAAAVDGAAPTDDVLWGSIRNDAEIFLREASTAKEVTAGATSLSRQGHAQDALEILAGLDRAVEWMAGECDDLEEQRWLRETVALVASHAFVAGRHMQAAWGKDFEHLAVSRKQQISALNAHNEGRNTYNAARRRVKDHAAQKAREIAAESTLSGMALAKHIAIQLKKSENGGIVRSPKTIHNWLKE